MSNRFDTAAPRVETPEQEAPVMYIFGLPCIQIDSLVTSCIDIITV